MSGAPEVSGVRGTPGGNAIMVSLSDLRARNVQPAWQEAVAVMQELVQTISATGAQLPDLEHVALIPNGDVVALPGGSASEDPVRQAALMLKTLVDGGATPPELGQFIEKNLGGPGKSETLSDFARNLSFYERPGRRADIERLAGRAMAAAQNSRADEELRRLKERTSDAAERRLDDIVFPDMVAMAERRRPTPTLALAGAFGLLVVLLAGGWWWWQRARAPQAPVVPHPVQATPPSMPAGQSAGPEANPMANATAAPSTSGASPTGSSAASTGTPAVGEASSPAASSTPATGAAPQLSLIDRTAAAVRSTVDRLLGNPAPPTATTTTAELPPPPAKPAKARRKPAPSAPGTSSPPTKASSMPATAPTVLEPPPPVVFGAPPVDENVYSTLDAAVIPPVLVRPVLPKQPPPGVPESMIGTIELLVDEQGDVEAVRLTSPANRFHERMLVSAAKMWKFRPAFKDGHPVRYRTRVRLTV
jgi:hypothetical protein